jgi:hypothetical protein
MPKRAFFVPVESWEGRHQSYTQDIEGYYSFKVHHSPNASARLEAYNRITKELQDIIAQAVQDGKSLRAMGRSWSLSKVGVSEHRLIDPTNLRIVFTLPASRISSSYAGERSKLRFFECGIPIAEANNLLFNDGLSLKASGSNHGQTLVGAVSTGTHGAAFKFGATPDFVVGLHIVTGPSTHVYLQRASYPVVRESFAAALGAELKEDDDLFNAALVSFGSFGIIHGMMIEARELFLLRAYRSFERFNPALKKAISSLNFSGLDLPRSAAKLYHFCVCFNPNEGTPPKEASVECMFEAEYSDDYDPPVWDTLKSGPGATGLEIIGNLIGSLPSPLSKALKPVLNTQVRGDLAPYELTGVFKDLFRDEKVVGKVYTSAVGVPLSRALDALAAAFDTYKNFGAVLPVILTLRFVKGTKALLGFTRFDPTCVFEIDSINTQKVHDYANAVWAKLEQDGIPFTMHWGKFNGFLTPERVRNMYGENVNRWIASREELLSPEVREVFTNDFLRGIGLAT